MKKKKYTIIKIADRYNELLTAYSNEFHINYIQHQLENVRYQFLTFMTGVNANEAYRKFKRRIMASYEDIAQSHSYENCILYGTRIHSDEVPRIPLFVPITKCVEQIRTNWWNTARKSPKPDLVLIKKKPIVRVNKYSRAKMKLDVFDEFVN